ATHPTGRSRQGLHQPTANRRYRHPQNSLNPDPRLSHFIDTFRFAGAIVLSILSALACAQTITADSSNPSDHHIGQNAMSRVTGIGGIFLKAKDPAMLRAWYKKHLGIDVQAWGGTSFRWVDGSGHPTAGTTAWFVGDGKNFAPSTASFMVNYRVSDLH
ncbi:MAG: VOC family protein, partial [Rudaea sp.]